MSGPRGEDGERALQVGERGARGGEWPAVESLSGLGVDHIEFVAGMDDEVFRQAASALAPRAAQSVAARHRVVRQGKRRGSIVAAASAALPEAATCTIQPSALSARFARRVLCYESRRRAT